ncbi:MAG: DUF2695 domain-containing protein [Gemmataceae bacterium]|nr:DUF2695 domain-containing protein [Gemmataceae bacterium]MCI0743663.1 DUF2695 domain-containing protein [Gemmataceae bacterium]
MIWTLVSAVCGVHLDKKRKKELLREFKQKELAEARRKMCLWPDQLRSLHAFLAEQRFGLGIACDHPLGRTKEWIQLEGLDREKVLESLGEFGGYCDCEVYFNVTRDKFGWPEQDSAAD